MNDEKRIDFRGLVPAIAKALGATVTRLPDDERYWNGKMTTAEGLPLFLSYRSHDKKMTVSVDLPPIKGRGDSGSHQSPRDVTTYEEQKNGTAPAYEIGLNPDKGAEKIAADITRRLIPGATELYRRACERRDTAEKYARDTDATVAMLAKRLKVEPRGMRLYCGGCTLEVSGPDSVRFDHLYVKGDTAAKIAALVLAEKGAE